MAPPDQWTQDPLNRALRVLSVVAFLGLIIVVVVDPDRSNNLALQSLLVGAILLQLGYDVALRLPDIISKRNSQVPQTPDNETGEEKRTREQTGKTSVPGRRPGSKPRPRADQPETDDADQ